MPELQNTPPAFYKRLFGKLCKDELFEELHGDLLEEFYLNSEEHGVKKARSLYKKEVIKLLRPSVIKRSQKLKYQLINTYMLRNYTKVAFRSLTKNKLFTFINITGLAIGMSVALLIVNLIFDALKFDQFHSKKDRIYRVLSTPRQVGFPWDETATAPSPIGLKMKDELPLVKEVVRIRRRFSGRISKDEGSLNYLNVSVQSRDYINTLSKIEQAWGKVDEDTALEAKFLDAELEEVNGFLLIFVRVFGFLGIIAASIACLGLLGMAVFNAESRTKEIGVRKAVGASVGNLIMILSKSFIKLIGLAGIFGGLVAYFLLEKVVLAQTYYHVNVGILEVLSALLALFGLAILAVGSQTWRIARTNPVDSLRYE